MKQKISALLKVGVISSIIWCILYEEISLFVFLIGFLLGVLSAGISFFFISSTGIALWSGIRINPLTFFKYIFILVWNIYKSGFLAIQKIITHKTNVCIVEIDTSLKNLINRAILANSITMTPGTVTIEMEDDKITVLWLDKLSSDRIEAGNIIKGKFEDILKRGEAFE